MVRPHNAEVDFVTSTCKTIVPIEVKAGKSGTIKSLQQFAIDKKATLTCRFDLNTPSVQDLSYRVRQKIQPVNYKLLSLPLYLVDVMHDVSLEILTEK